VAKLVEAGKWHTGDKNSIKGHYQSKKCKRSNPMFRSSYELMVHIWLDENDSIREYNYEPFSIPYYDSEGKKRYYFPDFLIFFVEAEKRPLLLEVKNDYAMQFEININKHNAATEYAQGNGMDYALWLNDDVLVLEVKYEDFGDRWQLLTEVSDK